jgi:hypothetical protein
MMAVNGLRPPMIPWPAKPPSRAALHQNRTALDAAEVAERTDRGALAGGDGNNLPSIVGSSICRATINCGRTASALLWMLSSSLSSLSP